MDDSPHMLPNFLAVEPSQGPAWWMFFSSMGGVGIFTGLVTWWTTRLDNHEKRRHEVEDRHEGDRKEERKVEAGVQTKRLELEEGERAWYREELRKNDEKREREAVELRAEMRQMRRTFGHEVRNLQQYNQVILDMYHACYSVLRDVLTQCRMMRARLKRMTEDAGGKFDEDEFPPVDATGLDPKSIPRFQPTNGWDQEQTQQEQKKITGFISLSDNDQKA